MNLDQLEKGADVHIIGRLRVRRRTTATGEERMAYDIIASKVEIM